MLRAKKIYYEEETGQNVELPGERYAGIIKMLMNLYSRMNLQPETRTI